MGKEGNDSGRARRARRRGHEEEADAPASSTAESARLSSMPSIGGAENGAYFAYPPSALPPFRRNEDNGTAARDVPGCRRQSEIGNTNRLSSAATKSLE